MVLFARLQIDHPPSLPRNTCTLCLGSPCGVEPSPSASHGSQAASPLPLCSCCLGPEKQQQEAKGVRGWTDAHRTRSACAGTMGCSAQAPCSGSWIHVQQGFMFSCARDRSCPVLVVPVAWYSGPVSLLRGRSALRCEVALEESEDHRIIFVGTDP